MSIRDDDPNAQPRPVVRLIQVRSNFRSINIRKNIVYYSYTIAMTLTGTADYRVRGARMRKKVLELAASQDEWKALGDVAYDDCLLVSPKRLSSDTLRVHVPFYEPNDGINNRIRKGYTIELSLKSVIEPWDILAKLPVEEVDVSPLTKVLHVIFAYATSKQEGVVVANRNRSSSPRLGLWVPCISSFCTHTPVQCYAMCHR